MAPEAKKKILRGAAIACILFLAASLAAFMLSYVSSADKITYIPDPFPKSSLRPRADATGQVKTILILGVDTRGSISTDLDEIQGTRSDSIMLARLDFENQTADLMSLMRDSWVSIPGYGENKLNAALSFGGVPLAIQSVEALLNLRVDHVAIIDMSGLTEVIEALGGIEVQNQKEFSSGGYVFKKGLISLNSESVLSFVRDRRSFVDGDYSRVENQRAVILAMSEKISSKLKGLNAVEMANLFESVAPNLALDSGLNFGFLIQNLAYFSSLAPSQINSFTSPSVGTGLAPNGSSAVFLDLVEMRKLGRDWIAGDLDDY